MATRNMEKTLSTLHRGFRVIEQIREMDGARVTELASEMDIAPSTAHKYLATLVEEGYVVKEGDEYHVGTKFLDLATYVKNRKRGYSLCIQKVGVLAEKTGERAQFVVEEHGRGVYIETQSISENAVRMNRHPGMTRPLHATSDGKAILAHLPEHRREKIIEEHGLSSETDRTITDKEQLLEELEQIRETGVAYNDEESVDGLRAVAVPVIGANDMVVGALSVSGPSNRLRGETYTEELPTLLLAQANEVELKIRYS